MRLHSNDELICALHESQERSLRALLEAWAKEIEESRLHLIEQNKKNQLLLAEEAAETAAAERRLLGLMLQAEGGADVSVSVPAGVRVASSVLMGPTMAELSTMLRESEEIDGAKSPAQRSAGWAMSHALLPHPSDLADIMLAHGIDRSWAVRFGEVGASLDALDRAPRSHPQLAARTGAQRLDTLADEVALIAAYGAGRTLTLVGDPKKIGDPARTEPPAQKSRALRPSRGAVDRALDALF